MVQPLIGDGGIRSVPFAQPTVDPALASLPPSVARSAGVGSGAGGPPSPPADPDTNGNGQLDPDEITHLQQAAATGDKESFDLLNALKLPLGVAAGAAALYGATRGGLALTDAVAKRKGMSMYGDQVRTPGTNMAPPDPMLSLPSKAPLALPAPDDARFNQPAPVEPLALPDHRSFYEKSGGKLPSASHVGELLRAASAAMRHK